MFEYSQATRESISVDCHSKKLSRRALRQRSGRMACHVAGGWALPIREDVLGQAGRLALQGIHLQTRSVWLKQARGPPPPKFGA
jgi:hypothetical protein